MGRIFSADRPVRSCHASLKLARRSIFMGETLIFSSLELSLGKRVSACTNDSDHMNRYVAIGATSPRFQ